MGTFRTVLKLTNRTVLKLTNRTVLKLTKFPHLILSSCCIAEQFG